MASFVARLITAADGDLPSSPPSRSNPETRVALRKLLEAKHAAMRAVLVKERG